MTDFKIRPATADEFRTAVDWAAKEGWNPGLDDLAPFHGTDPDGFIMGFLGDMPVSSISVVKYPDCFGFLGFYIVHPDHRGTGLGIETWNAGMAYLEGCTVGLDGVVQQQENYKKSGFVLAGRNVRHTGRATPLDANDVSLDIRTVGTDDLAAAGDFDAKHFPVRRDAFIRTWLTPGEGGNRMSLIAIRDGEIAGSATVRACRAGYKIGPLFAQTPEVAEALFVALSATAAGEAIWLDIPENNPAAVALAERHGLTEVFGCARMYHGEPPAMPWSEIYGVTTFELG